MKWRLCTTVGLCCSLIHNSVPHTFRHDFPCRKKQHRNLQCFRARWFFRCSCGNSGLEHGSAIVHNIFACFTLSVSATQENMIKERCWFSQINFFIEYFPHGIKILFLSSQFYVIHNTDKNNPFSRCTKRHSQFGIFSQPCFNRIFSNCLSRNSPAQRWPYRFRSRGTTGSSILDHDLGHLCRGRRIQMSGHSDFGIFNNLWASSIFTWV